MLISSTQFHFHFKDMPRLIQTKCFKLKIYVSINELYIVIFQTAQADAIVCIENY